MRCEDAPCCGHESGDCDGSLYGSDESIIASTQRDHSIAQVASRGDSVSARTALHNQISHGCVEGDGVVTSGTGSIEGSQCGSARQIGMNTIITC